MHGTGAKPVVGKVCGLCVLERLVQVVTYPELLNSVVVGMLVGSLSVPGSPGWPADTKGSSSDEDSSGKQVRRLPPNSASCGYSLAGAAEITLPSVAS